MELGRIARLGDEVGGAEGARVTRVTGVALPGENDDLDLWRSFEQFLDQRKALVRTVRQRRRRGTACTIFTLP